MNRIDQAGVYGDLEETVHRYHPYIPGPGYEHYDRQCEAGVAISPAVHLQCGTKKSDDKHGYAEGSHVARKIHSDEPSENRPYGRMAVPTKRCAEIGRASPRLVCITIRVEIAAQ